MSRWGPRDLLLAPAALYGLVVRSRVALYRSGILRARRLGGRVVSVGNLTVGGTGKTPAVIALAKLLRAPGRRLGVLTRGYGRGTSEMVVLDGSQDFQGDWKGLVARAGDEPVLLARHLPEVPVGVAADRFAAGQRLEREYGVNVLLLDDGFQYLRLERELNIVLLDASREDDGLLPRGRRREPWSALTRAQIILITRVEQADPTPWIRHVRAANPSAKIFYAKTVLESVRDAARETAVPPADWQGRRGLAFCGLGNPRAFLRNLADWGVDVAGRRLFPDHHRYTSDDAAELLRAAEQKQCQFLVTTEKDVANWALPAPTRLPMYFCRIALEIDQPDVLLAEINRWLEAAK